MGKKFNVRIPESLVEIKGSAGIGLFHLASGFDVDAKEVEKFDKEELSQQSIELSVDAIHCLSVLKNRDNETQQKHFLKALIWVKDQPNHVKQSNF
jgi:hypothetical protein